MRMADHAAFGADVEVERAALYGIIVEAESTWPVLRELWSDDLFRIEHHQQAAAAAVKRLQSSEPVDLVLVTSDLIATGHAGAAATLRGVVKQLGNVVNAPAYVRRLAELRDVRAAPPGAREIPLVRACDAVEKPIEWVIEGFLARGELTDLSGDPGVGKGGITASWAARITREDPHATVIFFATEDPLGRVKARLRAEGADLERVFLLDITKPGAGPVIPEEVAAVEVLVRRHNAALLVLDPALEFMDAELDSHKQQDVARFMAPLLAIAMRTRAALLTVRHNNKNAGASALHRASGSIGFTGKVRIALTAAKDNESGKRAIAVTKNNLGKDRLTVEYDVVAKDDASIIVWGETLALSADELVNQEPKKRRGPPPARLEAAKDALRSMLATGPMQIDDVLKCAKGEGIGRTTVYEASRALGVEKVTVRMRSGWRLPSGETPNDSQSVRGSELRTTPDNSGSEGKHA
jgi:putative DNA primase/helicase